MADFTIDFAPDGPTATWTTSTTPTRTRGETATLDLTFAPANSSDYGDMQDQLEFTDPVWTGVNLSGVPWVKEDLPARAPVSTQIFEITPGSDIQDVDAFWGVITGGSDDSQPARADKRVSVDVVFLADGSEYADRTTLKNDLGAVTP